jgi:hypothetical protein
MRTLLSAGPESSAISTALTPREKPLTRTEKTPSDNQDEGVKALTRAACLCCPAVVFPWA